MVSSANFYFLPTCRAILEPRGEAGFEFPGRSMPIRSEVRGQSFSSTTTMSTPTASSGSSVSQCLRATKETLYNVVFGIR